jgi:hypothetical protein
MIIILPFHAALLTLLFGISIAYKIYKNEYQLIELSFYCLFFTILSQTNQLPAWFLAFETIVYVNYSIYTFRTK